MSTVTIDSLIFSSSDNVNATLAGVVSVTSYGSEVEFDVRSSPQLIERVGRILDAWLPWKIAYDELPGLVVGIALQGRSCTRAGSAGHPFGHDVQ